MKQLGSLLVVLGALVALAGCGSSDAPPGPGTPDAGGTPDGGSGGDGGVQPPPREVTWYRDVLPLVQTRCQECHVAGGIAPFSLTTYADAKAMHPSMASAAANRRMPPWMPDDSCGSYVGSRRLSQAEIDTLTAWSEAGAPEGNPADAPPPPTATGTLPWVDVSLTAGADYTPKSVPTDDYRCFMMDPALAQSRDVIGYDIQPGVRSEVHHVILYVAPKSQAQAKEDGEAGLGWTCYGGPGTSPTKMLGGWVPGSGATQFPAGTGIRLKAGEVLVVQIHYNTSQQLPRPDRTVTKLQYSAQPVPIVASFAALAEGTFAIPPKSTGYSKSNTLTSPASVKVHGVLPHMHQLGKSIRVENTTKSQCYVNIPRWDFHWQQLYFFSQPFQVSAQDTLKLTCAWDNYTDRTVTWGESTSDEMCINYFYVTAF